MKRIATLILFTALALPLANAQTKGLKKVYDENINPVEQIDKAVAAAKSEGKFVVCQLGGNWCPWCLRFADFISSDNQIKSLIDKNFVYIHVNYDPKAKEKGAKAKQTAAMLKKLGNPVRFGFPVFVVLDGRGNVLHTQDSSFLEEGKGYSKEKVIRFFKNWTPEAVKQ